MISFIYLFLICSMHLQTIVFSLSFPGWVPLQTGNICPFFHKFPLISSLWLKKLTSSISRYSLCLIEIPWILTILLKLGTIHEKLTSRQGLPTFYVKQVLDVGLNQYAIKIFNHAYLSDKPIIFWYCHYENGNVMKIHLNLFFHFLAEWFGRRGALLCLRPHEPHLPRWHIPDQLQGRHPTKPIHPWRHW